MMWWIYLLSEINSIIGFMGFVAAMLTAFILFGSIFVAIEFTGYGMLDESFPKKWKRYVKYGSFIIIPFTILSLLLPDSKTIAAMIIIPHIVENKTLQGIGSKATTVLEGKLDEWMKDVTKAKK